MAKGQSATVPGNQQPPLPPTVLLEVLQDMVCDCHTDKAVNDSVPADPAETYCRRLGDAKHDCVDGKIEEHNKAGKKPGIGAESGWKPAIDPVTDMPVMEMIPGMRKAMRRAARAGSTWPDAVSFDSDGNPQQCFDFKFKCPTATYEGEPAWGDGQLEKQTRLTRAFGKNPKEFPPTKVPSTNC